MEKSGKRSEKHEIEQEKQAYSSLRLDWTTATGPEDLAFFPMPENLLESVAWEK